MIVRGPPHENRDHDLCNDRLRPVGEEHCKVLHVEEAVTKFLEEIYQLTVRYAALQGK